jgi:ribosomal RNA-processing protein 9
MSSFFTLPGSQKKRKRPQPADAPSRKSGGEGRRRQERDESISGSEDSEDERGAAQDAEFEGTDEEDDEFRDEDPAAKRIRLAEQYLANTQNEVLNDVGFDAAEVDKEHLRRRMGDRLKEDTAESHGKLYRWLAEDLDWSRGSQRTQRTQGKSITGVALQGRFAYTVQNDAVTKWELPDGVVPMKDGKQVGRVRKQLRRVAYTRGNKKRKRDREYMHHVAPILCIAASQDGKFVATGGSDNRLVVWDAATLKPLKAFTQHRDSVTSLAFRRGTNQLFSASKDRTIKIWSLDELAYVETLFGHQDEVVDISALAQEKCVTVGARDRTARLWKVVEESQLLFRGGGAPSKSKSEQRSEGSNAVSLPSQKPYHEGSMDRITYIDDDTFITGSDNGSISLWSIHKKKPVFTYPLAHGLEPPPSIEELSAEETPNPEDVMRDPQPRWITALKAIPFSDTFVTGSWDGCVRAWKLSRDKRRIEALGPVGRTESISFDEEGLTNGDHEAQATRGLVRGIVNDLAISDRGERAKDGVVIAAAVGAAHRLGRWRELKEGKTSVILFEVPRKSGAGEEDGEEDEAREEEPHVNGTPAKPSNGDDDEEFGGFD